MAQSTQGVGKGSSNQSRFHSHTPPTRSLWPQLAVALGRAGADGGQVAEGAGAEGPAVCLAVVDGVGGVEIQRAPGAITLLGAAGRGVVPLGLGGRRPPSQAQNAKTMYQSSQLRGLLSLGPGLLVQVLIPTLVRRAIIAAWVGGSSAFQVVLQPEPGLGVGAVSLLGEVVWITIRRIAGIARR